MLLRVLHMTYGFSRCILDNRKPTFSHSATCSNVAATSSNLPSEKKSPCCSSPKSQKGNIPLQNHRGQKSKVDPLPILFDIFATLPKNRIHYSGLLRSGCVTGLEHTHANVHPTQLGEDQGATLRNHGAPKFTQGLITWKGHPVIELKNLT